MPKTKRSPRSGYGTTLERGDENTGSESDETSLERGYGNTGPEYVETFLKRSDENTGRRSSMKYRLPLDIYNPEEGKKQLYVRFNRVVKSLINGVKASLGPENGRTVTKKGVLKGKPPFTGSTEHAIGRFLGKYELSYRVEKGDDGKPKYVFTTKYGDPDDPEKQTEYHELWYNPQEENEMRAFYRRDVQEGKEPRYKYFTIEEAHRAALNLYEMLKDEGEPSSSLSSSSSSSSGTRFEGGRHTRKQKTRKQKTRKQRKIRK